MGCAACKIDYDCLDEKIGNGDIRDEKQLLEAVESGIFVTRALVIYCPSCREKIERLNARIASRLRKQTLANISCLLDRAYEERKSEK